MKVANRSDGFKTDKVNLLKKKFQQSIEDILNAIDSDSSSDEDSGKPYEPIDLDLLLEDDDEGDGDEDTDDDDGIISNHNIAQLDKELYEIRPAPPNQSSFDHINPPTSVSAGEIERVIQDDDDDDGEHDHCNSALQQAQHRERRQINAGMRGELTFNCHSRTR